MKFFSVITNHLPKSVVDNIPSIKEVSYVAAMPLSFGLSVGFTAAIRALSDIDNSYCSDAGFDNVVSAMTQATFQSLALTLGLAGLIEAQKAFGIDLESSVVEAECILALAGLYLITLNAGNQIPIIQCSSLLEDQANEMCGYSRFP